MCTQEFQRRVTEGNVPHAALVTLFEMRRFDFTNLSAGTSLSVDADARLGAAANTVNFTGNAALILRSTNTFVHNMAISSGVTGSLDVLNGITATVGSATAAISGSGGSVQKSGLGTLILTGTNTYTATFEPADTTVASGSTSAPVRVRALF